MADDERFNKNGTPRFNEDGTPRYSACIGCPGYEGALDGSNNPCERPGACAAMKGKP